MTRIARVVQTQLQLSLEIVRVYPHPAEQVRRQAIEALADLLMEALGTEASGPTHEKECLRQEDLSHAAVDGRAKKTQGHRKPMNSWNVLLRDHHIGYISWEEYEENLRMLAENAYMQKRASRKAARGGKALLTGLARCGRCGRIMHVFYGLRSGHAHRYQCRGDDAHVGAGLCIGIGGVRIDHAIAAHIMEAVSPLAVDAAIHAAEQVIQADNDVRQAVQRELEEARYEASLAARRYEVVDPAKRLVARELESRWNAALERVAQLEQRLARMDADAVSRP
jgi:hypothetical protein